MREVGIFIPECTLRLCQEQSSGTPRDRAKKHSDSNQCFIVVDIA